MVRGHMRWRALLAVVGVSFLAPACGEGAPASTAGPASSMSAISSEANSNTTPDEPAATSSSVAVTPTSSITTRIGTALGPVADLELAEGPATRGPMPGYLPFPAYALTGANHTSGGSWTLTVGWNWIAAADGTVPDGRAAGYDWSLNLSGVPSNAVVDVPSTAEQLMTTSAFDFYVQNSSCAVGEGTATATSIWVVAEGVVVAVGAVSETVAECGWEARTMSPEELVDVLAGMMDCSFGEGLLPNCIAVAPVSDEERAAAAALLRAPGA